MTSKNKTTKPHTSKKSKQTKLKWWYILPVILIVTVAGYLIVNNSQAASKKDYISSTANFKINQIDTNSDGKPSWYDKFTLSWNDVPGIKAEDLSGEMQCLMDTGTTKYVATSFLGGAAYSGGGGTFYPNQQYDGWNTTSSTCYARLLWIGTGRPVAVTTLPIFQLPSISSGTYGAPTIFNLR